MQNTNFQDFIGFSENHIGSFNYHASQFSQEVFNRLTEITKQKMARPHMHDAVSHHLSQAIENYPEERFLLPPVVHYIETVRKSLPSYQLSSFEFWLNNFSEYPLEKRLSIRAKIVGKYVPRASYQEFFPIGDGKKVQGPHYTCAHYSPDLDTTVASFQTFLNAFGAEIAEARHHWFLPGGPPKSLYEIDELFYKPFGESVFTILGDLGPKIVISSLDLLTQKCISRQLPSDLWYAPNRDRFEKAVVIVDKEGNYQGDWRSIDIEPVRGIIRRFDDLLREMEMFAIHKIVCVVASKDFTKDMLQKAIDEILMKKMQDFPTAHVYTEQQVFYLQAFIRNILQIEAGYGLCFADFIEKASSQFGYQSVKDSLDKIQKDPADVGQTLFADLDTLITNMKQARAAFSKYVDSLEVAILIKKNILHLQTNYVHYLSDFDRVKADMKEYAHLSVVYKEEDRLYLLGVIHREDIQKPKVGSYSWIDFSNPKETSFREELDLVSVVDHHKSSIHSSKPSMGRISDAQSSNCILAEMTFAINDQYSTGAMSTEFIQAEIEQRKDQCKTAQDIRILQRLLQRKKAAQFKGPYYISAEREIFEYLQFLFAILDDTDCLTKMTEYDLHIVAELLNRIKSLKEKKEMEVVHFDDLNPQDPEFRQKAVQKLLCTQDLYSLYSLVYRVKEKTIEDMISDTANNIDTPFFQDTKLIADYALVGQFKLFAKNHVHLRKKETDIRQVWFKKSCAQAEQNTNIFLFLFFFTSLASAEDLFTQAPPPQGIYDEIWLSVPPGVNEKKGAVYVRKFLESFLRQETQIAKEVTITSFGEKDNVLEKELKSTLKHEILHKKASTSMIVVKVPPRSVQSRKSQIAPLL